MNRLTTILVGVFGLLVAYGAVSKLIYPKWIKPHLLIKDTIAQRAKEKSKLDEVASRVLEAQYEYKGFVERVGSFDKAEVEDDLRDRINKLFDTHGLEDTRISVRPISPGKNDRRTKLERMSIPIDATGTLQSVVAFLEDLAELPHLVNLTNPSITPTASSRREKKKTDRVDLGVMLEVWVLPQQWIFDRHVHPEDLVQPEQWVRYEDRDYSVIWESRLFWEPFGPLVAKIKKDVSIEEGRTAFLEVVTTGGDGDYSYVWEPSGGLTSPDQSKTAVDTSQVGSFEYTVTVRDASDHVATADGTVTVREKPKKIARAEEDDEPPEPPAPLGPQRWKDGRHMKLTSALISRHGARRTSEVMVYNDRSKETTYLTPGDDFDGGTLVYVHQTEGALVHRDDGYSVYPLGARLTEDIEVDEAVDCPRLQEVVRFLREYEELQSEDVAAEEQGPASAEESSGEAKEAPESPVAESDVPQQGRLTGRPAKPTAERKDEPKSDGPVVGGKAEQDDKTPGSTTKSTAERGKRRREPPRRPGTRKPRSRNTRKREKKD